MLIFVLAYLGGVLTIVSPCILPVLPFVFARADRPFVQSGLPMLIGMAVTFALVATLAAVAGGWAVEANQYGRLVAMALLALFGVALLFPSLATRMMEPVVALGGRLSQATQASSEEGSSVLSSLLLGAATGLLWAPCAGPLLGLILTGAALQGANVGTTLLLLAYALGAATSLALALAVGGKVLAAMKRSFRTGEWIRRSLGVAVLAAVAAIALGLDTGVLTRLSLASTASLEQRLVDRLHPKADAGTGSSVMMTGGPAMMSGSQAMMAKDKPEPRQALSVEGPAPEFTGITEWLNSAPLTIEALKGKVVLIDFWTYSCINCLRAIPYVQAWADKYKDAGLVVIGVHSPEFAFERDIGNVKAAVGRLGITYPVAIDNAYSVWRAFNNQYWPAQYFIDVQGRIRHHHFGEGSYDQSERVIQDLLAEAGNAKAAGELVAINASGVQASSNTKEVLSPETYLGYMRGENLVSPGGVVEDKTHTYTPGEPRLNEWGLAGSWTVNAEHAVLDAGEGGIVYRFHARDVHLVLGPGQDGKPVRFRVTIDGLRPGQSSGMDVNADGEGIVSEQRLYQLIRQRGTIGDRTFEIRFLDPGVRAYAFTFG
jgi:cytochrome c biogenesis protein CcdA/thiol-disulfide isomerase/thioredoxin